jgi:triosephosphate isomerase
MPRTIVTGNWKMHKTAAETRAFLDIFLDEAKTFPSGVTVVIAPPFTALSAAHNVLGTDAAIALGAQNVHWELQGAYTGDIAVGMLKEQGVTYCIVGHSERRAMCNELDRTVNLKVHTLLKAGVTPIVAVGETLDERHAGKTDEKVVTQTRAALDGLDEREIERVVMAYEPIWAIGTGHNCDPAEANRVMERIRSCVPALEIVPILYGGSMKAENVASYMAQPDINGGLVGGASLDPRGFATLVRNAA